MNPYLGEDSLAPFLEREDRGVVILCRTSNPGAREIQDLRVEGLPLFKVIAEKAASKWNKHGNIMLVVGATFPQDVGEVRQIVGDMPLLVPGVGTQGGELEEVVRNGLTQNQIGLVISASRSVIYAGNGKLTAVQSAACALNDRINELRHAGQPM